MTKKSPCHFEMEQSGMRNRIILSAKNPQNGNLKTQMLD